MINNIDLSIIIVNYNSEHYIKTCLESLKKHNNQIKYELFIVSNSEENQNLKELKNEYPDVIFIDNENNIGFAAANNKAIKLANGRSILLLNPDTYCIDNSIEIMYNKLFLDDEISIIFPQLIKQNGEIQISALRKYPNLTLSFLGVSGLSLMLDKLLNNYPGRQTYSLFEHNKERFVASSCGACMMFKKELIEQIGLLDEKYFLYYEETDYCYRANKASGKILFYPQAKIIHLYDKTPKIIPDKVRNNVKSEYYFLWKQHKTKLLLYKIVKIISCVLSFPILLILYLLSWKKFAIEKIIFNYFLLIYVSRMRSNNENISFI